MDLAIHFFLQVTVILGVCRVVGLLARRVGQPQVVGEMIAGVLLGPSLLGLLLPDLQHALFPKGPATAILFTVSQVGLVLYLFLIGLEFDTGLIRHRVRSAVSVSLAGIRAPLVLGAAIALILVGQSGVFFAPQVLTWQAMLFGAFLLGVAMARGVLARDLRTLLDPIVTNFLLPLFFVFSGLNTQIGLVNSGALWGLTLLVLVTAVLGKGVACTVAALLNKESRREALAIGSLMNARGLIELILLNLGLQAGIITPTLFAVLVFMAIVTTLMASPLFEFFHGRFRTPTVSVPARALRPAPAS